MGGFGSGRKKKKYTACELLMSDAEFNENVVIRTVRDYNKVIEVLIRIIKGEEKEYVFDTKGRKLVERPPALADRVKAAKVWKEMTLDKVVADKKMIAMPETQFNTIEDFMAAIQEVEKKLEGKIIPIGGN